MGLVPPTIPGADRRLTEYLRRMSEEVNRLNAILRQIPPDPVVPITAPPVKPTPQLPNAPIVPPIKQVGAPADQLVGSDMLISKNVANRLGRLAQPQIPYAPRVTALPPRGDPQSQDGSLVIFQNTLYQFTGGVDTGTWASVIPPTTAPFQAVSNVSVVVNANTTSAQVMQSQVIPANTLAPTGSALRIAAYGDMDVIVGPMTVTITLRYAAQSFLSWVFVPNSAGAATNLEWGFTAHIITGIDSTLGPDPRFSNGGVLICNNGAVPIIGVSQAQVTIALVSTVDITIAQNLDVTIAFSGASVSNVGRHRIFIIEQFS